MTSSFSTGALTSIVALTAFTAATETETELVRRARAVFKRDLTRAQVVEALGAATWAVLPKDEGPFAMDPGDGVALMLYWRNGKCTPVSAAFDRSMRLVGGEALAQCLDVDTNPGAQYACTKVDRAALCR
jgi:hypothetical protein